MRITFSKRIASGGLAAMAVLATWFAALPRCFPATDEARMDLVAMDDGLTRESVSALGRPELASAPSPHLTAKASPRASSTPGPAPTPPVAAAKTPAPTPPVAIAKIPAPTPPVAAHSPAAPPPPAAPVAKPTAAPIGTPSRGDSPSHPEIATRHHYRHRHHRDREVAQTPSTGASPASAHRGWASKFIGWWHGFVDRHFRSKTHGSAS